MMIGKFFDLSNLLKHAFISGRSSVKGCRAFEHNDAWTSYDPSQSAAFSSIVAAIEPIQPDPVGYAQGVAHARETVAGHMDWNPSTVRADLLLNIDHSCAGPVAIPDPTPADLLAMPDVRAVIRTATMVTTWDGCWPGNINLERCVDDLKTALAALVQP